MAGNGTNSDHQRLIDQAERGKVGESYSDATTYDEFYGGTRGAAGSDAVTYASSGSRTGIAPTPEKTMDSRAMNQATEDEYQKALSRIDESLLHLAHSANAESRAEYHRKRRERMYFAGGLAVFLVVVMAVSFGISYGTSSNSSKGYNTDSSSSSSSVQQQQQDTTTAGSSSTTNNKDGYSTGGAPPPLPVDVINVLCDVTNVETPKGHEACLKACIPGLCCYDSHGMDNCSDDHPEVCAQYGACGIALHGYSGDEDEEGGEVYDKPRPIRDDDGKGGGSDGDTVATTVPDAVPPDPYVDELCQLERITRSVEARDICKAMCSRRSCCFVRDTDGGAIGPPGERSDCRGDNPDWCAAYAPCENLGDFVGGTAGSSGNSVVAQEGGISSSGSSNKNDGSREEDIKAAVDSVCSRANLKTPEGNATCLELCEERECCFEQDAGGASCSDTKPQWCATVSGCKVLYEDGGEGGGGTTGSDSTSTLQASGTPNEEDDNRAEDEEEEGGVKALVDAACSKDNLRTEDGMEECMELCEERPCCFTSKNPIDECHASNPNWCNTVSSCNNLLNNGVGDGNSSTPDEGGDNNNTTEEEDEEKIKSDIDKACSHDNIKTARGKAECLDICDGLFCCVLDESDSRSCQKDRPDLCAVAEGCQVLFTAGDDSTADASSSSSPMADGAAATTSTAKKPSGAIGTVTTTGSGGGDADEQEVKAAVERACSTDNVKTTKGEEECMDLCETRTCCFSSDGGCSMDRPDWCATVAACHAIYEYETSKGGTSPAKKPSTAGTDATGSGGDTDGEEEVKVAVERACSADNVKTSKGEEECMDLCELRTCCFASDEDCSLDRPDWCATVAACQAIYEYESGGNVGAPSPGGGSSIGPTSPQSGGGSGSLVADDYEEFKDLVGNACSPASIRTDEGEQDCLELCETRTCCFASDASESCMDARPEWCGAALVCKALLGGDGGNAGPAADAGLGMKEPAPSASLGGGGGTPGTSGQSALDFDEEAAFKGAVDRACSSGKLETTEGEEECMELCEQRSCCLVEKESKDSCSEAKPAWCKTVSACKTLWEMFVP